MKGNEYIEHRPKTTVKNSSTINQLKFKLETSKTLLANKFMKTEKLQIQTNL